MRCRAVAWPVARLPVSVSSAHMARARGLHRRPYGLAGLDHGRPGQGRAPASVAKARAVIRRRTGSGFSRARGGRDVRDAGGLALSNIRVDDDRLALSSKMLARLPAGALKNVAGLPRARSAALDAARSLPVRLLSVLRPQTRSPPDQRVRFASSSAPSSSL